MIGDKHAFLEIDALVPVSDPTLRWPGANRGAKSESCLPLRWPKGECLEGLARDNPISEDRWIPVPPLPPLGGQHCAAV